jgi:predicted site-specific integrase-resolvase
MIRLPELAKTLGVSQITVRGWMQKKIIPFIQIKRCILFDEAKVMRALNRYERTPVKPLTQEGTK